MNKELADKINASGTKSYFCVTGGGQTFIGEYLALGGASKSVVGMNVPYSQQMFDEFVGKVPKDFHYCSEEAARLLAVTSYSKAIIKCDDKTKCYGFGVTCSLAKENEREGRVHKAFIAVHCNDYSKIYPFTFKPNLNRNFEESIVKCFIEDVFVHTIFPQESVSNIFFPPQSPIIAPRPLLFDYPVIPFNDKIPVIIFPGSWNPWHEGHAKIFDLSYKILKMFPIVELSVSNADKNRIDYFEVVKRLDTIPMEVDCILTDAPTFKDKVIHLRKNYPFNPIIFVVGADTWTRIWNEKYCGELDSLADFFSDNNVKFLVFGRSNINMNKGAKDWYGHILRIDSKEAEEFHSDISSTMIRNTNKLNEARLNEPTISWQECKKSMKKNLTPTHPPASDIAPRQSCRFPTSFQTVDNVITKISKEGLQILLGRKNKDGNKWRFPGGFVDPSDLSLEAAAKRERIEEVGINLECTDPFYLFSFRVNDERYKNSVDKVLTAVMLNHYQFGFPVAGDDLDEVKWFNVSFFERNYNSMLIDAHVPIAKILLEKKVL